MEDWLMYLLLFVASVVVIGVVVFIYYRKNNPKAEKCRGRENKAERAVGLMRSFARNNSYRIIAPAQLVRGDKTANLDAIVVGYFGVLGVKALGYNGEIYGSANEKEWLQVAEDGTRTPFSNPLDEATADVRVIRDALFSAKLKQIPVEVVCVFTASKAQIALPRNTGHYTVKEFKSLLHKDKYTQDKGIDLDVVEKAIAGAVVAES